MCRTCDTLDGSRGESNEETRAHQEENLKRCARAVYGNLLKRRLCTPNIALRYCQGCDSRHTGHIKDEFGRDHPPQALERRSFLRIVTGCTADVEQISYVVVFGKVRCQRT